VIGAGGLSIGLAGAGGLVLGVLGLICLRDPAAGLRLATHRAEALPTVMGNRYLALAGLVALAMLHGDLSVLAALFAVLGLMGLHDASIYARAGHGWWRHATSGCLSLGIAGLAWFAHAGGS
jgi:hypothetical protein